MSRKFNDNNKKRPKVNTGHNENGLGRGHNKWKKHIKEHKGT